jgi:hypothetical protein
MPKYHLSIILIQKWTCYYPRGRPKSLKLLYSIMNLNTIGILALVARSIININCVENLKKCDSIELLARELSFKF